MINNFTRPACSAARGLPDPGRRSFVASRRAAWVRGLTSGEYLGYDVYAGVSAEIEFPIPVLPGDLRCPRRDLGRCGLVERRAVVPGAWRASTSGSVDNNLKASVGASLIWDSPFGPLRGDFAYVINKATVDRTQVFQLSIQNFL